MIGVYPCAWCGIECCPTSDDTDTQWVYPIGEGPFLASPNCKPYCGECQNGKLQFYPVHSYEPLRGTASVCERCVEEIEEG